MPVQRKKIKKVERLNLIPILDAVFIFIFFLLMSAQFINLHEIGSDLPAISDADDVQKNDKEPLNLTLKIYKNQIQVMTGVPGKTIAKIGRTPASTFDLEKLHKVAYELKKQYQKENSVVIEPVSSVKYSDIIDIIDEVRIIKKTDPPIFIKDRTGEEIIVSIMFGQIIFSNLASDS